MSGVSRIPDIDRKDERRFPLGAAVRLAELDVDPYPILARLRAEEPVSWVPEVAMWFVTRRQVMFDVLRDARRFTTDAPRSTIRDIFGSHMMTTDGDVALRYKRACLHAFRADVLAGEMAPWVRSRTRALIRAAISRAGEASGAGSVGIELMEGVATPLAVASALRVLGLPSELSGRIGQWYEAFAEALANFSGDPEVRAGGKAAAEAFGHTVRPLLTEPDPEERGLLTRLAARETDPFSEDEIIANALIILFGGIETTASMIGNTLWSLLASGTWADYVAGRWATSAVIEEVLRWQPAVQSITRHTTEDVELLGVAIPKGSVVQSMIGAANRDDATFDRPDDFDPDRPNASEHLSFGTGRHLCLGAHLARIEIGAVLEELRDSAPALAWAAAPAVLRGYEFRRPVELRVTW